MLPEKIRYYIESYFLRSHEEIDEHGLKLLDGELIEVPVVKRTAKRRRKTREVLLNSNCDIEHFQLQEISKTFSSPGVKRNWPSEEFDPYYYLGALMKIINYELDEKSIKEISYVMGRPLFEFVRKIEEKKRTEEQDELTRLKCQYKRLKEIPFSEGIPIERTMYMNKILDLFDELLTFSSEKNQQKLPAHWRHNKKILFLHFLLAFYLQMKTKIQFDWKEIGADYFSEIGGSKRFDAAKKEFLQILEELDFPPVSMAGLLSLGSIVYIPFSGQLSASMCEYHFGTVHSVTDHAVFADSFSTTAKNLWLVENRGVITRFAYEKDFLKSTNSLVIGVEGQLKSAVKRFIRMVFQNSSSIEQVLIWTDYDEAGVTIANAIYEVLIEEIHKNRSIKWIVPVVARVVKGKEIYNQRMKDYLRKRSGEQEEGMEGVNEWLRWMEI